MKYIVSQKEAEDILALYLKTVFVRDDVLHGVTQTLTKAGLATLDNDGMKDKFGTFILKIASNENVKSTLYQHYLVKPAKRIFSFGLINGDND